jgi:hypothetical protein
MTNLSSWISLTVKSSISAPFSLHEKETLIMSDDWAKKYLALHQQKRHEEQQREKEAETRRRYAEAGAPEKFHAIRERMKRDIEVLREDMTFQAFQIEEPPLGKFRVVHLPSPRATLDVDLHLAMVRCEYNLFPRESSKESNPKHGVKILRICSDLDGNLTVYKNEGSEAFADEAEISEFLLKLLLDHING